MSRPSALALGRMATVFTALLCALGGVLGATGAQPSSVAMCFAIAFAPYALLIKAELPSARLIFGAALFAGGCQLLSHPVLSDDVYRYLWDGRVVLDGIDPYRFAPNDSALAHLRDEAWRHINHREVPTIYPPIAQALFALLAIFGSIKAFQAFALVCVLLTGELLRRHFGARPLALFVLNPLVLAEGPLSAHFDGWVGAGLLFACALAASGRPLRAALAAGFASGVKLVGLLFAPAVFRSSRKAAFLTVALTLVFLAPLITAGQGSEATGGLGQYARRWKGNTGAFDLVEAGCLVVVDGVATLTGSAPTHIRLPFLKPLIELAEDTPLDPRASLVGEKKAVPDLVDFQSSYIAGLMARALVLLILALVAWRLHRAKAGPVQSTRALLLVGLLLAPQVHPWYLLWLLPLELAAGGMAGLVFSGVVLAAYAPLDHWRAEREWIELGWIRALEHGLVWAVLLAEIRFRGKNTAAGTFPDRGTPSASIEAASP